eukprot:6970832-Alexandrium_andersonii.AAC.1
MSASLVGSEMCIRDRRRAAGAGGRRREPRGPRSYLPARAAHGGPAGHCGCLLYTSDAADDM